MYVTAIVLAAGRGLRLESRFSKPLIVIKSCPLVIYCLDVISKHPYVRDIIVVVNPQNSKEITNKIRRFRIKKVRRIVLGGRARQDSVRNGLKHIDRRTDLVLIHDGVRPFISTRIISAAIKEAKKCGAAVVGVPVKSTIKVVARRTSQVAGNFIVEKTLDRSKLWEIQTPQVFKKELILKAYRKSKGIAVTDDAMLVEKLGAKVSVVLGSYNNIKITTQEDLVLAEAILR